MARPKEGVRVGWEVTDEEEDEEGEEEVGMEAAFAMALVVEGGARMGGRVEERRGASVIASSICWLESSGSGWGGWGVPMRVVIGASSDVGGGGRGEGGLFSSAEGEEERGAGGAGEEVAVERMVEAGLWEEGGALFVESRGG